jgi:outer membrane protein TolC
MRLKKVSEKAMKMRTMHWIINKISNMGKGGVKLFLMLTSITAAGAGFAQQTDSLPILLREAAANNPGIRAKYSSYLAALEKVPQAGSLPDPEMQFGYFIQPMELMEGYQLADFRFMQMMPWFGTLRAARDESSKMALARLEEMHSVKNDLFFQMETSWNQLFRTKQEIRKTGENLVILRSLERLALVRFKSAVGSATGGPAGMSTNSVSVQNPDNQTMTGGSMGSGTSAPSGNTAAMQSSPGNSMNSSNPGGMVDVLNVRIEITSLENRMESLKDQLITEKIRFNSYLNRKPDSEVFVPDTLPELSLTAAWVGLADSVANNPMVRMLEADRAANEARITMATRMGYPMIGLGVNYSLIRKFPDVTSPMNGQDMIMPMVTLTLPVYRSKYRALKKEAGYLRDAAAESATSLKNELLVKFKEALREYSDADRRLNSSKQQASLTSTAIALLTASFSAAGTGFEEILRMQQQLLDLQLQQIEAGIDKNLAVASLKSIVAINIIPE